MVNDSPKFCETYKYGKVRLRKFTATGIWQARYYVPSQNKYQERSTGRTVKRDAEEYVDRHINPQLLNQAMGIVDDTIPIEKLFSKFIESKEPYYKPKSMRRIRSTIHIFLEWLKSAHPYLMQFKHISSNLIDEFIRFRMQHVVKLSKKTLSKRTIDGDIINLATIFNWAVSRRLVSSNPAKYSKGGPISLFRPPPLEKPVFTKQEYHDILAQAQKERNRLIYDIVVVLANTGMRYAELANMTTESINWDTGSVPSITIRATSDFSPKHKSEVKVIPMLPEVEEVLRKRCAGKKGKLFINSLGNLINPNNTRKSFYRIMKIVGIDRKVRPLNWHSWRRYFVKNAVESGIPINNIMKWTGHDTVSMVMHYSSTINYPETAKLIQRIQNQN